MQTDGQVGSIAVATRQGTESIAAADATLIERTKPVASFDAPFDEDYSKRKGYDPNFLGNSAHRVAFPVLGDALEAVAAPLLKPKNGNKHVLHYHNYSVVMHAQRRLPDLQRGQHLVRAPLRDESAAGRVAARSPHSRSISSKTGTTSATNSTGAI